MRPDMTSVLNAMKPANRTSEPNSPIARANASAEPARIAGSRLGRMMRRKGEKRDSGDDGRQRERQVDHAVQGSLPRELVPDQDPCDRSPREDVDEDDDQRRDQRPPERPPGLRVRDRVPERAPAAVRRLGD